ncbi:MAG: FAD-binding oxidoreductase [Alphaproteobacteria bacterium]
MAMKIVVIGAGIIGASVAYHLAARGAAVTVLTGGERGGIATAASFAWINASPGNARPYYELRMKAILDWHRLQEELQGGLALNWNGSLWWTDDPAAMEAAVAECAAWGYAIHLVSHGEAARREPGLSSYPAQAAHAPMEGSLPPRETAQVLLRAAAENGALINDDNVLHITSGNGRVVGVRTGEGEIGADHVVLAAGVGSGELAAAVEVTLPMENRLGFLAQSAPLPPILRGLVLAPGVHMRQNSDGRIIAGKDFAGGAPPEDQAAAAAESLMAAVRRLLADGGNVRAERHTLGLRPVPADGMPVIGPAADAPGLYVTVMHSGITLAALVGRLTAEEILTGRPEDLLAPYRLERFAANP